MQVAVLLQGLEGLKEVCPGVRSCLIEYEPRTLSLLTKTCNDWHEGL